MSEPTNPAQQPTPLEQWNELTKQFQQNQPQNSFWTLPYPIPHGGGCPACGFCPHCGRGGYHTVPRWPSYPSPYWYVNPGYFYTTDRVRC